MPELFLQIYFTVITICISIFLIYLYQLNKIDELELVLYSFACQTFNVTFIGPTISPFFFISYYTFFLSIKTFINKGPRLLNNSYKYFFPPALSGIGSILYYLFGSIYSNVSIFDLLFSIFYFQIKYFLPLLSVLFFISKSYTFNINKIETTILTIAKYSIVLAIFQFLFYIATNSDFLIELIGAKSRYIYEFSEFQLVRVQALFTEPKNFAAFLGISLPLFLKYKKTVWFILSIVCGLLTNGQTFYAVGLSAIIGYLFFFNINSLRIKILSGVLIIFLFFTAISILRYTISEFYLNNSDNYIVKMILGRGIDRFDLSDEKIDKNILLGIPLQSDLELPMVLFFYNHPYSLLAGIGPANLTFISPEYWSGQWNYELLLNRKLMGHHLNMRWLYYISIFGLIGFIFYFHLLTKIGSQNSSIKNYYSFLWLAIFFIEVEIILLIYFIAIKKIDGNNKMENKIR